MRSSPRPVSVECVCRASVRESTTPSLPSVTRVTDSANPRNEIGRREITADPSARQQQFVIARADCIFCISTAVNTFVVWQMPSQARGGRSLPPVIQFMREQSPGGTHVPLLAVLLARTGFWFWSQNQIRTNDKNRRGNQEFQRGAGADDHENREQHTQAGLPRDAHVRRVTGQGRHGQPHGTHHHADARQRPAPQFRATAANAKMNPCRQCKTTRGDETDRQPIHRDEAGRHFMIIEHVVVNEQCWREEEIGN